MKEVITYTVCRSLSSQIEVDSNLSIEEKQNLIAEDALKLEFGDMVIIDCSDEDLIE